MEHGLRSPTSLKIYTRSVCQVAGKPREIEGENIIVVHRIIKVSTEKVKPSSS